MRAYSMSDTHGSDSSGQGIDKDQFSELRRMLMPGYLMGLMMLQDKGVSHDQIESKIAEMMNGAKAEAMPEPGKMLDYAARNRDIHEADYARQHELANLNPAEMPLRAIAGTQQAGIGLTNEATAQPGDVVQTIAPVPGATPVSVTERTAPREEPDTPPEEARTEEDRGSEAF